MSDCTCAVGDNYKGYGHSEHCPAWKDDRITELESQISECAPYLKEHESVAECIDRNRKDWIQATKSQAKEMIKRETIEEAARAVVNDAEFDGDISTVDTADLNNLSALLQSEGEI